MSGTTPGRSSSHRDPLVAVVLALALGFVLTCLISSEPVRAFRLLLSGALPDIGWSSAEGFELHRTSRFGAVIEDAITLCLLGLAMLMGLRARQFSMGADGQLFLGALAAAWVSLQCGEWPLLGLLLAVLAAVAAGFAWGGLAGLLKVRWGASEIVTTLMLNVVAIQFYRWVITHHFNDPSAGYLASPALPAAATFTPWLENTSVSVFVILAPLLAWVAWKLIERSTLGFEIRAVGDSPDFARQCGMPVARTVVLAMALGGAFAGIAGLHVSNALLKRLPVDLTPGMGFEGLVVALLARNDPKWVPVTALGYAYLKGGAQAMERGSDVSREVVLIIQALLILFVGCQQLLPGFLQRWRLASRSKGGAPA